MRVRVTVVPLFDAVQVLPSKCIIVPSVPVANTLFMELPHTP